MIACSRLGLAVLFGSLFSISVHADVLFVPGQFATISAAVNAAQSADTIMLAPGVYTGPDNLEVDFGGKSLVLTSEAGPDSTIIDCNFSGLRALILRSGEDSSTIISGVTFKNGDATSGMVDLLGSSPHFRGCVFSDYYLDGQGTALQCDSARPTFEDCLFRDNIIGCSACKTPKEVDKRPFYVAGALKIRNGSVVTIRRSDFIGNISDAEGPGGAILAQNSTVIVDSSIFSGNLASDGGVGGPSPYGGALAAYRSSIAVTSCRFDSNFASAAGGAIYADDSSTLSISDSQFEGNSVDNFYRGGALYGDRSKIVIVGSSFLRNRASHGGGLYCRRSEVTLSSSLVAYNVATDLYGDEPSHGGGLYASNTILRILGTTFSHNLADSSRFGEPGLGGGVYLADGSASIDTSIVAFSAQGAAVYIPDGTASPQLTCSNLFGNSGGDWYGGLQAQLDSNGNTHANPYFCAAELDDFSLYDISPCADSSALCGNYIGAFDIGCINLAPVIISPDTIEAFENQPFVFRTQFSDDFVPDTSIVYEHLPSWLAADGDSLFGTLSSGDPDTSFVTIVSDGFQADTLGVFVLAVATNTPPHLVQVPPRLGVEGDSLTFMIYASDPDSTVPNLTADSLPFGAVFDDYANGAGRFRWTPDFWQAGQYEVFFMAADDSSAADTMIVAISVENRNAPPTIFPVADTSVFEGDSLILVVTAADPDSTKPSLYADVLPATSAFAVDSTGAGIFRWSPDFDAQGLYALRFIAVDDSLVADTLEVMITVLNVNRPPIISAPDTVSVLEGDSLVLTIGAIDPDSTVPSLSIPSPPPGSEFTDVGDGSGLFRWMPGYNQHGAYEILIVAEDDSLASDSSTLPIIVVDVDVPPALDSIDPVTAREGDSLYIPIRATDADGTFPTLRAESLPPDAQFIDNTSGAGMFEWVVPFHCAGVYVVTFIAEDTMFADTATLEVTILNRPPEIHAISLDGVTDNMHVINDQPIFSWIYLDGAQHSQEYAEIEVGNDSDWFEAELWNPDSLQSSDTLVMYDGAPLLDGETYFIRIRAHNGFLWSAWTESLFRMNTPPSPPTLVSPVGGEIVVNATPAFSIVRGFDLENDSLWYECALYADQSLTVALSDGELIADQTDTVWWTPQVTLVDDARYWWRARSWDGYEFSAWSEPDSFLANLQPSAPGAFNCIGPPSEAYPADYVYEMLPTFIWSTSHDADPQDTVRYTIELALLETPEVIVRLDSIVDTTFAIVDSLLFGRSYRWHVEAIDVSGLRTYSNDSLSFRTWMLGDMTRDFSVDLSDLLFLINYLYLGGPAPAPLFVGDVNGDCSVDLSDLIYFVNTLFLGGPDFAVGCGPD